MTVTRGGPDPGLQIDSADGPVPEPKGRVGLISLGCPKNTVDSEVMLGELERQG